MVDRVHTWGAPDGAQFEYAHAYLRLGALSARGTLLVGGDEPYRVDYQLDTGVDFVLKRLTLHASGAGAIAGHGDVWSRTLRLARDFEGSWTVRRTAEHPQDQITIIEPTALSDATDCDIAGSSLPMCTPVMRHRLHKRDGRHVAVMAWVALPELSIHRRERVYTRLSAGRAVRLEDSSGRRDLAVDDDGFITGRSQLGAEQTRLGA